MTGALLGADGRRIPVSDTDHIVPRLGETMHFIVRFVVPSTTPPGTYHVEMALYVDSKEPSDVWRSDRAITVGE